MATWLGRTAERRGGFVRLMRDGGVLCELGRDRSDKYHRLHRSTDPFRDALCMRAQRSEHAGLIELNGTLLSLCADCFEPHCIIQNGSWCYSMPTPPFVQLQHDVQAPCLTIHTRPSPHCYLLPTRSPALYIPSDDIPVDALAG